MGISNLKGASFNLVYEIFLENENDQNIKIGDAVIKMVFLDYNRNKPCPVPESFTEMLTQTNYHGPWC